MLHTYFEPSQTRLKIQYIRYDGSSLATDSSYFIVNAVHRGQVSYARLFAPAEVSKIAENDTYLSILFLDEICKNHVRFSPWECSLTAV